MSKLTTSKVTIYDVAKKAGVGIGTVSRVLNNHVQVRPKTRARVLEAITELGFKPSSVARQLSLQSQIKQIGVITQTFVNYYAFTERLRGIQQTLNQHSSDYELLLYTVSSLEHYQQQLANIVQTRAVEGLIIIDLELSSKQLELLEGSGIPFVGINHLQNQSWPCIGTNNVAGGYLATKYLLSLGHTRIAYVGDTFVEDYTHNTSRERFDGYKKALEEAGIKPNEGYVGLGKHDYHVAKENTEKLLNLKPLPTAIFAMSDMQALGCIAAIKEKGLRVPEDVSVLGYDDLDIGYHTGLSTVRQHLEESGVKGIEYLLGVLNNKKTAVPKLPEPKVVPRQTTRALE
jgi:DNA-binding LacI/PurR family transcriptional regulator